jgi:hypothetical protein
MPEWQREREAERVTKAHKEKSAAAAEKVHKQD